VFVLVRPTVRERERDRGTGQFIAHLFIPVVINYSSFTFIVTRDQFLNRFASIASPVLQLCMIFGSSDVLIWTQNKSNNMQQCIKFFFISPYLYKAQHVSSDTPPVIRSLKLH